MSPLTDLVNHAAEVFDTTAADILAPSGTPGAKLAYIVRARQAVCYVASRKLGMTPRAIGRKLSGRDRTTVEHAIETAQAWARRDAEYRWALGVLCGE